MTKNTGSPAPQFVPLYDLSDKRLANGVMSDHDGNPLLSAAGRFIFHNPAIPSARKRSDAAGTARVRRDACETNWKKTRWYAH